MPCIVPPDRAKDGAAEGARRAACDAVGEHPRLLNSNAERHSCRALGQWSVVFSVIMGEIVCTVISCAIMAAHAV